MNNNTRKNALTLIDKLMLLFQSKSNIKKKGPLAEMILKDDFHNKHQTEEDYQEEQKAWLRKMKTKKTG